MQELLSCVRAGNYDKVKALIQNNGVDVNYNNANYVRGFFRVAHRINDHFYSFILFRTGID
jgi:hypothetical protein